MERDDKNEIIYKLRQETGLGLMTIEKALDTLVAMLKRMPHKMDVGYDLEMKWVAHDQRKIKKCLRPECVSCSNNTTGLYPCFKATVKEVQDFLDGKSNDCPEWYDEY